jgi:hypothetical protein
MRLPDPFTPNLKVDMLADISHPPRILVNFASKIQPAQFKKVIHDFETKEMYALQFKLLCPPLKKGRHIALLQSVGRSTSSFCSFSLHWLHILK